MLLREEKGAAIFVVLIALMVLTVLGSVIAFVANTEGRQSVRQSDKTQAYYLARSGAEIGLQKLEDEYGGIIEALVKIIDEGKDDIYGDYSVDSFGEDAINFEIKDGNSISIKSTGKYNGVEEIVTVSVTSGMGEYTIFSGEGGLKLVSQVSSHELIEGKVGTTLLEGDENINNESELPIDYDIDMTFASIDEKKWNEKYGPFEGDEYFKEPQSYDPGNDPNPIKENARYSNTGKNRDFEIDTSNEDLYIYGLMILTLEMEI